MISLFNILDFLLETTTWTEHWNNTNTWLPRLGYWRTHEKDSDQSNETSVCGKKGTMPGGINTATQTSGLLGGLNLDMSLEVPRRMSITETDLQHLIR